MNLLFWRKKQPESLPPEKLAWNLIYMATDPDKCWALASQFRRTGLPNNVMTCETSFLLASVCREVIRSTLRPEFAAKTLLSAEAAYTKAFEEASEEEQPPEMLAVYGGTSLREVASDAFTSYAEYEDLLPLTLPVFVRRIRGDPRMAFEIQPLVEEKRELLRTVFKELLGSAAR
jgi:Txe/YoeB family toxin of Txe-Axe toxin-antitoxin module